MNYPQLSKAVADKLGITQREGAMVVNAVFDTLTEAMIAGDKVSMVGFGNFEAAHQPARTARNPRTGEAVDVPAKYVPKFKPSTVLKAAVNAAKTAD